MQSWLGCVLIIILMLGFAPKAKAFLPDSQNKQLNLSGRSLYPNNLKGKYEGQGKLESRRLRDENEPERIGLWNSWGTIHRLFAPEHSKPLRLRGTKVMEEEIRSLSYAFIEEYSAYFKIDPDDLKLVEIINRGGIIYCKFKQLFQGINVYGGGIEFRFDEIQSLRQILRADPYEDILEAGKPADEYQRLDLLVQ